MWGVGTVLPIAMGGVGLRAVTESCSFALLSFARASEGVKKIGSGCRLLLGNAMGRLCGTTTSTSAADEDLDEEEVDLVRTEGPDLPPLGCSSAAEVPSFI